jgi:hypothetical protein
MKQKDKPERKSNHAEENMYRNEKGNVLEKR